MGVTFNLVDQGVTRTGVYCHITNVYGPTKNAGISDDTDGRWYITYGLVYIKTNQSEIMMAQIGLTGFHHSIFRGLNGQVAISVPIQQWRFCTPI